MKQAQAQKYLRDNRDKLEQAFNDQYPNLPVGGFYNPRVVSVFSGDIEFFCHYDNYASRWDGWTWFFDTVTGRFYN